MCQRPHLHFFLILASLGETRKHEWIDSANFIPYHTSATSKKFLLFLTKSNNAKKLLQITSLATMKFTLTSAALLSLVASSSHAFTPGNSFGRVSVPTTSRSINSYKNTKLNVSTLADEEVESSDNTVPTPSELYNQGVQTEPAKKSYLDDGFVFGMEGSGLERPKGKVSQVVVEGDTLESTPFQQALVATTFTSQFAFLAYSYSQIMENHGSALGTVEALALVFSSWVAADFGSGVLHWSVDNYGNGRTPVMGNIIAAFQGHHTAPWTITQREFCNNVHKLCYPFGIPTVAAINFIAPNPGVSLFFTIFCMLEIMSQEFHKWSHTTPKEVPAVVNQLQKIGLTIGRAPHAKHHTAPFEGKYCIVSGFCNERLDQSGFFRRLEHIVYNANGVESNSWKLDPELKAKTLRGEYALDI